METPESEALLESVIKASGLATIIAKGVILRCCTKANLSPEQLTLKDLATLIPHIEPMLKMYIAPSELPERLRMLRVLQSTVSKAK